MEKEVIGSCKININAVCVENGLAYEFKFNNDGLSEEPLISILSEFILFLKENYRIKFRDSLF